MREIGKARKKEIDDTKPREVRWKELVCIMETLEEKFGWKKVEGTSVYTKDEAPEHKSNILGEGWRKF